MTEEQFNKRYDVFHSKLVANADYDGCFEMPKIRTSNQIPNNVMLFSRAVSEKCKDFNCWVIFYEHDCNFIRLWNNPQKYLNRLKRFNGVISPDFSLYRNMPLVMQMWNTYKGRAIAAWLQDNGIEVIPNVRWNDERTFDFCFDGIERNSTVSIGTHGCIWNKADRTYFKNGLAKMVGVLNPKNIIVYGRNPDDIFAEYKNRGINIIAFESELAKSRKQVTA